MLKWKDQPVGYTAAYTLTALSWLILIAAIISAFSVAHIDDPYLLRDPVLGPIYATAPYIVLVAGFFWWSLGCAIAAACFNSIATRERQKT